jgi:hypothetical protein
MKAMLVAVVGIAALALPAAGAEKGAAGGSAAAGSSASGSSPGAKGSASAAPAKPTPPAARDLSRALLTSDEWSRLLDRYSASLTGQLTQSLQAQKEPVPGDLQGNLRKKLGEKLPYDQAVDAQAKALANHFTADELKQAATFYSSPTGKKVLTQLPQALSELGDELQGQLATTVPEIVSQVAPKALGPGHGDGSATGTGSGAPSPDGSAGEQSRPRGSTGPAQPK